MDQPRSLTPTFPNMFIFGKVLGWVEYSFSLQYKEYRQALLASSAAEEHVGQL